MGARWDNVTAASAALGTNAAAGAISMALGAIVGSLTRSRATGYVVAGGVQALAMVGVGAYYATKHPRYAGGVSTLGLGTGLATVVAGAALAAMDGPAREALVTQVQAHPTPLTHPASAAVWRATTAPTPQPAAARPEVIDLRPLGRTRGGVERFGL